MKECVVNNKIAFVICTRDNKEKMKLTLQQALDVLTLNISIYIVDQSKTVNLHEYISPKTKNRKIIYIHVPCQKGHSKAKNTAVESITEEVIAWTDDDCIITKSYVKQLNLIAENSTQLKKKQIAGIFGRTLPFLLTKPANTYVCPCTFSKNDSTLVKNICAHYKYIGFGNNMIIFRQTFLKMGNFREWLGVGTIGENGDDGEFMIRCLFLGYKFAYDSKLTIFHNKWLSEVQNKKQSRLYKCGGLILYGFYYFKGVDECKEEFLLEIIDSIRMLGSYFIELIHKPMNVFSILHNVGLDLICLFKGIFLALWYAMFAQISNSRTR